MEQNKIRGVQRGMPFNKKRASGAYTEPIAALADFKVFWATNPTEKNFHKYTAQNGLSPTMIRHMVLNPTG